MSLEAVGSTQPLNSFRERVPRVDYARMAKTYESYQPTPILQIPKSLETYARSRITGSMKRNQSISVLLGDWINRAYRTIDQNQRDLLFFRDAVQECAQKNLFAEGEVFEAIAARFSGFRIPEIYHVAVQARDMDRKDRERAEREKYGKGSA